VSEPAAEEGNNKDFDVRIYERNLNIDLVAPRPV
jgi:hypothetical protein